MKIVIIGVGGVGEDVLKTLAAEHHTITIIDDNKTLVERLVEKYDVYGVVGNGASIDIQIEAGVKNADVAIVLTKHDEMNIFACLVAKKLGVKNTVARVRNPDYRKQIIAMKDELGISLIINPELDTATAIFNLINLPAIVEIERFSNGNVLLVEVAVEENSSLVGKTLRTVGQTMNTRVLICAIQRGDNVIIPAGDFEIQADDKICFTANAKDLREFLSEANIVKLPLRNIMIVGGGRIAYYLAKQLSNKKYRLKLIESNSEIADDLAEKLPKVTVVNGPVTRHDVLLEEGIEAMDSFVALTDVDEENMIISMFADSIGVKKTITKIQNEDLYGMFGKLGIKNNVSPNEIVVDRVVSYIKSLDNTKGSNVMALYRIVGGQVEALEFAANKLGEEYNKPLKELKTKDDCLVACVIRNGECIIPDGNTCIQNGDNVVVVTTQKHLEDLVEIFN